MLKRQFKIRGLDCAEEVAILKRQLGPVAGEANLSFDVLRGRLTVYGAVPEDAEVVRLVAQTGMSAELWDASRPEVPASKLRDYFMLGSGVALLGGYAASAPMDRALFAVAALLGGWFILPKAWFAARHLRPDMNFLMTAAVGGAIAIGDYAEAATVAFLFAVSNSLEAWSVGRARRAVEALLKIAPDEVELLLQWLESGGHLSQARFIESRVHARQARFGNLRIRQELKQHGLSLDEPARQALQQTELLRAHEVWRKKFKLPAPDAASRLRQMRFLAGRGFSPDVVRQVVRGAGGRDEAGD